MKAVSLCGFDVHDLIVIDEFLVTTIISYYAFSTKLKKCKVHSNSNPPKHAQIPGNSWHIQVSHYCNFLLTSSTVASYYKIKFKFNLTFIELTLRT